ncbi:hypothetical protein ACFP3U_22265 [Kitasatospora misakiensis]|uniref:Lipoprotein n=1 Tax=Kitasatospora misakiensis TaxID=67330 RepID=A0ABW0X7I2_9ACTN
MSTAHRRTAGRRRPRVLLPVLLAAAALALPVGCAAPGELRDHGGAAPVTRPPAKVPLWPGLATAPSRTPLDSAAGRTPEPSPQPVPDVAVPGQDITAVDVRALLAKDPGVTQDERRVLQPCAGCELRSPEYRDLTGDGRPELLVAVSLAEAAVLHVYTASGDRLLPVLRVPLMKLFGAETVGTELWLYEPTTASTRTSRLYHWDGVRLALADQKVEGIGPTQEPAPTPQTPEKPSAARPSGSDKGSDKVPAQPVPTIRRSDAPNATPAPSRGGEGSGAGAVGPKEAQSAQPRPITPSAAPPVPESKP